MHNPHNEDTAECNAEVREASLPPCPLSSAPSTAHVPSAGPDFLSPRVHWLHPSQSAGGIAIKGHAAQAEECVHTSHNITKFKRRPSDTDDVERYPSRARPAADLMQGRIPATAALPVGHGPEHKNSFSRTEDADAACNVTKGTLLETNRVEQWLASTNRMPPSEESSERSSNADSATTFSSANTAFTTDDGSARGMSTVTIRVQPPAIFKVHKDETGTSKSVLLETEQLSHDGPQKQHTIHTAEGDKSAVPVEGPKADSIGACEDEGVSHDDAFSVSSLQRCRLVVSQSCLSQSTVVCIAGSKRHRTRTAYLTSLDHAPG